MAGPEPSGPGGGGQDGLRTALERMHVGEGSPAHIVDIEPNPWTDRTPTSASAALGADTPERTLYTPDPSSLNSTATESFVSAQIAEPQPHTSQDILLQFDPLARLEEQAAREAWASSGAHPPPSPTKEGVSPPPVGSDKAAVPVSSEQQEGAILNPPSAAATAFPGLAALARTFSLGGRSPRPRSLETATAVPSPATLSSFAQQQSAPPTRTTMVDPENSSATEVSGSGSPGNRNPDTDRGKAAKDNPPFDFQKLLDQMKLKGAEPVAKYLRSYVCVTTFVCLVIDCIGYMRAS